MQCSECDYKSVSVSGLTKHMKKEHPDVDAKAMVAGTKGKKSIANVVQRDGDEYTAVVMGKCKHCDYANENLIKLKAHVRRYHKKGAAQCPHCSFSASTKSYLSKHIANKHPGVSTPSTVVSATSGVEALMPDTVVGSQEGAIAASVLVEADLQAGSQQVPVQTVNVESLPTVAVESALSTVSIMEDESGGILVVQNAAAE